MKQVNYTVTPEEQEQLKTYISKIIAGFRLSYDKNPERYGSTVETLLPAWQEVARAKAIFEQLEKDGVATITREKDDFFTFADWAGDCFDPDINNNVPAEELKTQRKRALARFNRNGVWYHTLYVLGEELDAIGGFVGKDFNGSGYDTDFFASALKKVGEELPDYYSQLIAATS